MHGSSYPVTSGRHYVTASVSIRTVIPERLDSGDRSVMLPNAVILQILKSPADVFMALLLPRSTHAALAY